MRSRPRVPGAPCSLLAGAGSRGSRGHQAPRRQLSPGRVPHGGALSRAHSVTAAAAGPGLPRRPARPRPRPARACSSRRRSVRGPAGPRPAASASGAQPEPCRPSACAPRPPTSSSFQSSGACPRSEPRAACRGSGARCRNPFPGKCGSNYAPAGQSFWAPRASGQCPYPGPLGNVRER